MLLAALIGAYAAVALSPYPVWLARSHPDLASFFRPPWFNFSETYLDGAVMGFRIGQSRADFRTDLLHQSTTTHIEIAGACGRASGSRPLSVADSFLKVDDSQNVAEILGRATVCLYYRQPLVVLIADFDGDALTTIELAVVRSEVI